MQVRLLPRSLRSGWDVLELMFTHREILNKVRNHLVAQGTGSMGSGRGDMCFYRGANGTKCAIGVLIPDFLYDSGMEASGIYDDVVKKIIADSLWLTKDISFDGMLFLERLQQAHDTAASLEYRLTTSEHFSQEDANKAFVKQATSMLGVLEQEYRAKLDSVFA